MRCVSQELREESARNVPPEISSDACTNMTGGDVDERNSHAIQQAIDTGDAQGIALAAIAAAPDAPMEAMYAKEVPAELRAHVERMLHAYQRARELERAFVDNNGAITQAIDDFVDTPALAVDREIPTRVGNYRIVRTLAVSGGSAVLLAQQESPIEREVALKLIFEDGADPRVATRVSLERQILASLEHPNIARIYDFGYDERNRPYLVMEYVRGGAIDEWLRLYPLGPREIVRVLVLPLCAAVRAAHARGVLHCDLKSSNVLVQPIDGQPHPKVIDFGIARAIADLPDTSAGLVNLPAALGTLRWMSPEALTPGVVQLDVQTDVFGLGLMLYALLAGHPARTDATSDAAETLRSILEDPVPRLANTVPSISRDLDAIVAKACARAPTDRYSTVEAFVHDLELWLAGREVAARPQSAGERLRRGLLRYWKVGVAVAALIVAAAAAFEIAESPSRARREELEARASSALASARMLRVAAGRSAERDQHIEIALDAASALLAVAPDAVSVRVLRDAALEEAILARIGRNERTSPEVIRLIDALLALREQAAAESESPQTLERLSVALAYKADTVLGTPALAAVELRQLALDEELHARFPNERLYADNLSWTYQRVHDGVWHRGERELALEYLHRSDAIAQQLLAQYPRTAGSLYTAAAAAWYEAFALETEGRTDDAVAAASRARALATELLRLDPTHIRGATFLFRAAISEADIEVESGRALRATEVLAEARAIAAPIVALERGSGFFGFPIAESWNLEANAWLTLGEVDRAEFASDMLRQEIAREREGMARSGALVSFTTAEQGLRIRLALRRGQYELASSQLDALIVSSSREALADRGWALDEVAHQLFEQRAMVECSQNALDVIAAAASALDVELAAIEATERDSQPPRASRLALEILLGRRDAQAFLADAKRRHPAHSPRDERNLRRLERMSARIPERVRDASR
ncbi:MAG: serine/threonine-protein kinase [Limnohabitans sp.]|nr:serine/threonine-protein kinase [Limnohabitans sp.]